jgi:tetratricopeptide (TPR) repeat protein
VLTHSSEVERAVALARELGDREASCEFIELRGKDLASREYAKAITVFREVTAFAERYGLDACLALVELDMGKELNRLGHKSDAIIALSKAYSLYEAQRDIAGMSDTLGGIAELHSGPESNADDLVRAVDYYQRALELIDPRVYRYSASCHYLGLGTTYYRQRRFADSRHFLEMALAVSRAMSVPVGVAIAQFHLAQLDKDEKRYAQALARLDDALPTLSNVSDKYFIVEALLVRAEALAQFGPAKGKSSIVSASATRHCRRSITLIILSCTLLTILEPPSCMLSRESLSKPIGRWKRYRNQTGAWQMRPTQNWPTNSRCASMLRRRKPKMRSCMQSRKKPKRGVWRSRWRLR